ncbi:MAG: hypothetical protein N3A54_03335 [Patescibacteria group bacterium]|nr:hypothetical protein [Patescibacteria group bacterium]
MKKIIISKKALLNENFATDKITGFKNQVLNKKKENTRLLANTIISALIYDLCTDNIIQYAISNAVKEEEGNGYTSAIVKIPIQELQKGAFMQEIARRNLKMNFFDRIVIQYHLYDYQAIKTNRELLSRLFKTTNNIFYKITVYYNFSVLPIGRLTQKLEFEAQGEFPPKTFLRYWAFGRENPVQYFASKSASVIANFSRKFGGKK